MFHKDFRNNIWKIEIDGYADRLAVEMRDAEHTLPAYSVLNFTGSPRMEYYQPGEKDWILEGIQRDFLILKKVGLHTPVKEGIQVVHSGTAAVVFTCWQHTLLDVREDYLLVRHRTFSQGAEQYMRISNGTLVAAADAARTGMARNRITLPRPATAVPDFLDTEAIAGDLWMSRSHNGYLWSYHTLEAEGYYQLHLVHSDSNQIYSQEVVFRGMAKMFPQPYFQVGQQLFFLSGNRREIISYLV